MKSIKLFTPIIFISLVILLIFSQGLFAENDEKESSSLSIFSNANRPLPEFDHTIHEEAFEDGGCAKCHHVKNEDTGALSYAEGEEASCSECHLERADGNLMSIREASHASCTICHRSLKKENKNAGPTSCGECHKKEK